MKTQNTTSNTAASFTTAITPVATMASVYDVPHAANDTWSSNDNDSHRFAEEATYWMIVATACAFQLLLVNLLTVI